MVAIAFTSAVGCTKPTVKLADIEITGIDAKKISLLMHLSVDNPNKLGLDLSSFVYTLSAAGNEFAGGKFDQETRILGDSISTVKVPVDLEFSRIAELWKKLDASKPIPYEFSGTLDLASYSLPMKVPFSHSGMIPKLSPPSWTFKDVRLGGKDIVEVVFDVRNPNDFELPIDKLTGALKFADVSLLEVQRDSLGAVGARQGATLIVPVRVGVKEFAAVAAKLATGQAAGGEFTFDGDLRFGTPESLREMLMGDGQ